MNSLKIRLTLLFLIISGMCIIFLSTNNAPKVIAPVNSSIPYSDLPVVCIEGFRFIHQGSQTSKSIFQLIGQEYTGKSGGIKCDVRSTTSDGRRIFSLSMPIVCIDGYKAIAINNPSSRSVTQIFDEENNPLKCKIDG